MVTPNQPPRQSEQVRQSEQDAHKDDGKLEHLAGKIDPPGREVKNSDLKNPGGMTPDAAPVDNRS